MSGDGKHLHVFCFARHILGQEVEVLALGCLRLGSLSSEGSGLAWHNIFAAWTKVLGINLLDDSSNKSKSFLLVDRLYENHLCLVFFQAT